MSELQQAAERLRNNTDLTVEDLVMLAKAYLAEHRADDGELITDGWITSIREAWPFMDKHTLSIEKQCHVVRHWERWMVEMGVTELRYVTTRGQLRQLCRSLGVEIKEKTE